MKRLFWLALGLGAGTTAAVLAGRWMRRQRQRLAPSSLISQADEVARELSRLLGEEVREFRKGMSDKETELRSTLE